MSQNTKSLTEHYEEFTKNGYTIFEQLYSPETVESIRKTYHHLQEFYSGTEKKVWWFGNACELAPDKMLPIVSNALLLDFTEMVMGPFVQLDNLTLAGFPSVSKDEVKGKVSGWHRDRWASYPTTEDYVSPLSMNAISYLQELTDEYGPLRAIPGSHRQRIGMEKEDQSKPHADEVVLHMKPGDVIVTHNGLMHSGTPNTSGDTRYFFSIYYNKSWLKHTDNHSGPNTQKIIKEARLRNDHRILRLFGVDDHLEARANSGFLESDDKRWSQWAEADKAAIKEQ